MSNIYQRSRHVQLRRERLDADGKLPFLRLVANTVHESSQRHRVREPQGGFRLLVARGGFLFLVFTIAVVAWVVLLLLHHHHLFIHQLQFHDLRVRVDRDRHSSSRSPHLHEFKSSSFLFGLLFFFVVVFFVVFFGKATTKERVGDESPFRPRVPRDASRSRHYYYGQNEHTTLLKKTENEYSA